MWDANVADVMAHPEAAPDVVETVTAFARRIGLALGGGLEVCLATHYRIVTDNPRIQLGLPESKIGLLPGGHFIENYQRVLFEGTGSTTRAHVSTMLFNSLVSALVIAIGKIAISLLSLSLIHISEPTRPY